MGSVHRRTGDHVWDGVTARAYDDPAVAGVEKHELIGPAEGTTDYRVRYFHVPAGVCVVPPRPGGAHSGSRPA